MSDEFYAQIQKANELNLKWEVKDFALEYACARIIHGDCRDHLSEVPCSVF